MKIKRNSSARQTVFACKKISKNTHRMKLLSTVWFSAGIKNAFLMMRVCPLPAKANNY